MDTSGITYLNKLEVSSVMLLDANHSTVDLSDLSTENMPYVPSK